MVAVRVEDEPEHGMQQLVVDQVSYKFVFVGPQQLVEEHLVCILLSVLPEFVVYGDEKDLECWDYEA